MLCLAAALLFVHTTPAPKSATLQISLIKAVEGLHPLAFAPAPVGSWVAMTLENNSVRIVDAATRNTIRTFTGHPQPAYAIAWTSDAAHLATGDESGRIFIWDTRTGKKLREMRKHTRGIQNLSFNLPGTMLVSTGKDDIIKVWNVATGQDVDTIPGHGANFYSATFEPRTNTILTGFLGSGCRFYEPSGKVTGFLTGHDNQGVWDVAFNQSGSRAVTAGRDNNADLWDVNAKKCLGKFKGHSDWVVHSRFSPNGTFVATSSTDRSVRVFNSFNYQKVAEIDNESAVGSPLCFTADGKYLLTVGVDDSLQVNAVTPPQTSAPQAPVKKVAAKKRRGKKH